jgi:hypothetical protein
MKNLDFPSACGRKRSFTDERFSLCDNLICLCPLYIFSVLFLVGSLFSGAAAAVVRL